MIFRKMDIQILLSKFLTREQNRQLDLYILGRKYDTRVKLTVEIYYSFASIMAGIWQTDEWNVLRRKISPVRFRRPIGTMSRLANHSDVNSFLHGDNGEPGNRTQRGKSIKPINSGNNVLISWRPFSPTAFLHPFYCLVKCKRCPNAFVIASLWLALVSVLDREVV